MSDGNDLPNMRAIWLDYLRLAGLSEEAIPDGQLVEMQRAFYAAAGSLLIHLVDAGKKLPNARDRAGYVDRLFSEVDDFWGGEMAMHSAAGIVRNMDGSDGDR